MGNAKAELAVQLHDRKYNCCQAVACAFADEVGVDMRTVFKASEGFGLGMGCMRGMCGALSGAVMLAGIMNSDGDLEDPKTKGSTYQIDKQLVARFEEKTGALICKDLKGIETGIVICPCQDCIIAGVECVQEILGL